MVAANVYGTLFFEQERVLTVVEPEQGAKPTKSYDERFKALRILLPSNNLARVMQRHHHCEPIDMEAAKEQIRLDRLARIAGDSTGNDSLTQLAQVLIWFDYIKALQPHGQQTKAMPTMPMYTRLDIEVALTVAKIQLRPAQYAMLKADLHIAEDDHGVAIDRKEAALRAAGVLIKWL